MHSLFSVHTYLQGDVFFTYTDWVIHDFDSWRKTIKLMLFVTEFMVTITWITISGYGRRSPHILSLSPRKNTWLEKSWHQSPVSIQIKDQCLASLCSSVRSFGCRSHELQEIFTAAGPVSSQCGHFKTSNGSLFYLPAKYKQTSKSCKPHRQRKVGMCKSPLGSSKLCPVWKRTL